MAGSDTKMLEAARAHTGKPEKVRGCKVCGFYNGAHETVRMTVAEFNQAKAAFASEQVRERTREIADLCNAIAKEIATFHSTMPSGALQCERVIREKYLAVNLTEGESDER